MDAHLLILLSLAVAQAVETWCHGSLFTEWRAYLELFPEKWWAYLLLCPYCLMHWVAAVAVLLARLGLCISGNAPWGALCWLPVEWLVVTWLALRVYAWTHEQTVALQGAEPDDSV